MIELLVWFAGPVSLVVLALITGSIIEHRHIASLLEREGRLHIGVTNLEPGDLGDVEVCAIVGGQAVIAADRFKVLIGNLVSIFGGELKTLTSVMARARREAILRMLEQAEDMGADQVWNVRLDTSNIGSREEQGGGSILAKVRNGVMAEIHAYGTAVRLRKDH